ncbi:MAG: VanZ family protein [Anaerovoracaceae bacterium]|nr:VanZ family protein [Anaerovoracaceae bacterium]
MLLGYLENLALDSLDGKGIAYVIDMRLIIKYIIAVFVIHFIIYITIKRRKFVPKEYFAKAFFAFYFVILMSFTLLPIEFPGINEQNAVFNFSLKPILLMFLSRAQLINIAGNVILFAPISILGYVSGLKVFKKLSTTAIFMLIMSIIIESLQYFEMIHGYTSITVVDIIDIITNITGGVLGFLLVKFWNKSHGIEKNNDI